jgi:hypothetical protein
MNAYAIAAPAGNADPFVPSQGIKAPLLPIPDIRGASATSPKMTAFSLPVYRLKNIATAPATDYSIFTLPRFEPRVAYRARLSLGPCPAPPANLVALHRTIPPGASLNFGAAPINRLPATLARLCFAIAFPIERLARFALIPGHNRLSMRQAAFLATITSGAELAWDWSSASFTRVRFRLHSGVIIPYCTMARDRIFGDAPLFAEII